MTLMLELIGEWKSEKKRGILKSGDHIIAIQGWRGGVGHTNTFRMLPVP